MSDCGIRSSVHTQRNITHEQVSAKHRSPETHQRCASLILPSSYEANGANNHLSFSTVVINRTPIITQLNYNLLLPVSYISITAPNTFKHVSTAFEGKGTSSLSLSLCSFHYCVLSDLSRFTPHHFFLTRYLSLLVYTPPLFHRSHPAFLSFLYLRRKHFFLPFEILNAAHFHGIQSEFVIVIVLKNINNYKQYCHANNIAKKYTVR